MSQINQVPSPYEDTTCQMVMAYGNSSHSHLKTIRTFRDEILSNSFIGEFIIDSYYRHTGKLAAAGQSSELVRKLVLLTTALPAYAISKIGLKLKDLMG